MSQTKLGSFAEAWANIFIGFTINYAANLIILPLFGFHSLTAWKNFEIGLLYTLISLARSYVLRRWFNGLRFGNATAR
jgi:ABC-type Fe3+-siderophore transport system permease subunit